jgi:hypothetical protein
MPFFNATSVPSGSRVSTVAGVLNLVDGNWFTATLDGTAATTAFALAGEQPGEEISLELIQAASGGPYAMPTLWSGITWLTADGAAPTMPSTASAVLILGIKALGGNTYYAWVEGSEASALRNINARVAATVNTITTVQAAVTGLAFPIGVSEQWSADYYLTVAGSTGGVIFQVTGPASPTSVRVTTVGNTTAITAFSIDTQTAFATGSSVYVANATPYTGSVKINVCVNNNATTSGTVQLTFAAQTSAQTNSVLIDSFMLSRKLN